MKISQSTLRKLLFISFIQLSLFSFGQDQTQTQQQHEGKNNLEGVDWCASGRIKEQNMLNNPEFRAYMENLEQKIQEGRIHEDGAQKATVYTIPVVFHVIHLGEAEGVGSNISAAQVNSCITALNEDYRKMTGTNGDGNGVDIELEFCLAVRDDNDQPHSGINRINGAALSAAYSSNGISGGGAGEAEATVKGWSWWDNLKYLNVWSVTEIDGNDGGSGTQGYAYPPVGPGQYNVDGVVALYNAIGTVGTLKSYTNMNRTMTHEVGHYFNLDHTFLGGSCSESNCNTDGDKVCDTPPTAQGNTCSSVVCAGANFENYMDYTAQECQDMFTQGQKDRMRATLSSTPRLNLLSSQGCQGVNAPTSDFSAASTQGCQGTSITYSDLSSDGPTSWAWQFEGGTPSTSTAQNPSITYSTAGTYSVTLTASNTIGTGTTEIKTGYITIYGNVTASTCGATPQTQDLANSYGMGVYNVTLNTINNTSDGAVAEGGYQDLTCSKNTVLAFSTSYNISVTVGTANAENVKVWIDYNNDGALNETNELVFSSGSATGLHNGSFTTPAAPATGSVLRMRVTSDFSTITSSCYAPGEGQVEDYGVIFNTPVCTGPPVTEFVASTQSGCTGSSINFTDQSTQFPTSWAWQFEGGSPSTSTSQSPSGVSYAVAGTYGVTLTATNACGSDPEIKAGYITINATPGSACAVQTTDLGNGFGMGIQNFTFNTINHNSGNAVADNGYLDLVCSESTTLNTGTLYNLSVTVGTPNTEAVKLYIDYDNDNAFNETNELVWSSMAGSTGQITGSFTTPATPTKGVILRARLISDWSGNGIDNSCDAPEYGQAQDYGVFFPCNIPVSDFSVNDQTICEGTSVTYTDATTNGPTAWAWEFAGGTPATSSTQNPSVSYPTAGTYAVTLTATSSCGGVRKVSSSYVTVYDMPSVAVNTTNITCNGLTDGTATANVTGGTTAFTYLWSNAGNTATINSLAANTYDVTVTDANSCVATGSGAVTEPAGMSTTITPTNITCNGNGDGSIDFTVTGGTGSKTFLWSNTATTEDISSLAAASYTVTVTDASGCTKTATASITEPTALSVGTTPTNVTCAGNDGAVSSTVSGGTPTYAYAWSNSATTANISNLSVASYTVTVTDQNGCTGSSTAAVANPAGMSTTVTGTNVTCNGGNDGTTNLTVSGGQTPYTFLWTGGSTNEDLTGVTAGTYNVTVTDNNSCNTTNSIVITEPTSIAAAVTTTNATCNGMTDAQINQTVSGGAGGYTFLWSNTATSEDITNLAAGSYTVTITDGAGCTYTATSVVTEPTAISASAVATDANCNGGGDGSINLTAGGGTGTLTFAWDNGAGTNEDPTGLMAGTYTVTVSDANACTATTSATVAEPTALNASAVATDVSCDGGSDGSIALTVTGGTTAYTFAWDNGAGTNEDPTNLSANTYNVTVTDANGCSTTTNATVNSPAGVTITTAATNVACNGDATGAINLTAVGGTPTYNFVWSNAATTEDLSNLTAAAYSVTVTDASGCSKTASQVVTEPTAITITTTPVDANCGNSDGSISTTVSGGAGGYTYLWSNAATTNNLTAVAAASYTVSVTDANSCMSQTTTVVNDITTLASSIAGTNLTCNGDNTGAADLTATGGQTPYTFNWSTTATSEDINTLAAGSYTVTVTDNASCKSITSIVITEPTALTAATTAVNADCNGAANGSIDLTPAGGTTNYSFLWSNAATSEDITNLIAGSYTVTITDANGCIATATETVTEPAAITSSAVSTDVACNGGNSGTINLTVGGGAGGFTFAWDNGAGTGEDPTGLVANTYTVTITDANGCTKTETATVNEPTALSASTSTVGSNCGLADGSASSIVSGGTTAYTYAWSNAATTANITNVLAGSYGLTVTDANGCSSTATAVVNDNTSLASSIVGTDVLCNGDATGAANLTATGGQTPYSFNWSNAATSEDITNLVASTYSVTVTDGAGCKSIASTTITEPSMMSPGSTVTNVSCNGDATGAIDVTVTGGTTPYGFSWSSGQTTEDLTNVVAGVYGITITDANGCSMSGNETITEPSAITLTTAGTNVSCNGGNTGSINLTATGGAGGFNYLWDNGAGTGEDPTGLVANTYTVTATDANGCMSTTSIVITEPTAITVSTSVVDANCGLADGSATATAAGGAGGFTYVWNTAATTGTITNVIAANYFVTATDVNGCEASATATVNNNTSLASSTTQTNVSCNGGGDGSADLTPTGGQTPYTFNWSTGSGTEDQFALTAGVHLVTVTDNAGCVDMNSVTITEPTAIGGSSTATNVTCFGLSDGSIQLTATGGTSPYTFVWSNGSTAEDPSGLVSGSYTVTVTDANGCTDTGNQNVTEPTALTAGTVATNASCNGSATGSINLTVAGGTPAYTFAWDNGAGTNEDPTNLAAGTYNVTATDNNGCTVTATETVTEPTVIVLTQNCVDATTPGGNDGSSTVSASGGASGYTYSWNTGSTTATDNGLTAGIATVTVTDANGCEMTSNCTVYDPNCPITVTETLVDVTCNGNADGSVSVAVAGGSGTYGYNWTGGATTNNITGLTSGSYSVTVSDAQCPSISGTYVITEPTAVSVTAAITHASCFGDSDGAIDVTPAGGVGGYTYTWAHGPTSQDLTNIVAGNYMITATDTDGCEASDSYTVNDGQQITLSTTATDAACFGSATGSITLDPSGGAGSYSYLWSNGATVQSPTNLVAGSYQVTATKANGCRAVTSATVSEPASGISASTVPTDATCNTGTHGSIALTVSGGTPGYTFNWDNGAGTVEDPSGLAAATYTVTITDAAGCTTTSGAIVGEPTPLALTATTTSPNCNGESNGAIDLSVSGGTPGYTYVWSNAATSQDLSNIPAGSYNVTVTDNAGCSATNTTVVTEPTALTASATASPVTCEGGSNGSINLTAGGGTGALTFAWDNGAGTVEDPSGLSAGSYNVTVTDANGCSTTANAVVTEPIAVSGSAFATDVSCNGGNNGSINLTPAGGNATYTFAWDNGAGTNEDPTGLSAGTYAVTITDGNGCTGTTSAVVGTPTALVATLATTDGTCFGSNDGAINLTIADGTPGYTQLWSTGATAEDLSNVAAAAYSVTVTDNNGCTTTASTVVNEPTALSVNITVQNAVCATNCDGNAVPTVSGGTTGYTYAWSTGSNVASNTNLCAGAGDLTVTDANGCSAVQSYVITEPTPVVVSITSTNATCNGASDGTATANGSGGSGGPYTYQWNSGENTASMSNASTGTYCVTATDGAGCTGTACVVITEPSAITATSAATDATCNGAADGSIDLTAGGGTGALTYAWDNGAGTNQDLSGLGAGSYSVTITDANGCTLIMSDNVGEPTPVTASAVASDAQCNGATDGSINLTAGGGTGALTFAWDNAAGNNEDPSGLAAGTYNVTVTDANGCTATTSATVAEPTAVSGTTAVTDVLCNGDLTGGVDLTPAGGTGSITYMWSNGTTTEDLTNVATGVYLVTMTDANGCTGTSSATITEPTAVTVTAIGTDLTCNGNADGSINATATGGAGGFTYAWDNGAGNNEDPAGLAAGTYTLTATDGNGCSATTTVVLTEPTALTLAVTAQTDASCAATCDGTASVVASGGTTGYSYLWSSGDATANATNLCAGVVMVTVTDNNGCTTNTSVTIAEPSGVTITTSVTDVSCNTDCDGTIVSTVAGGTGPYVYAWSNGGAMTPDAVGLCAGPYTVTVIDGNGCISSLTSTVTEPQAITVTLSPLHVNCNGASDGVVSTSVQGGTPNYSFLWDNGSAIANQTLLAAGSYTLSVTDDNGCTANETVVITEPSALIPTLNTGFASCAATDGTADISANGGTTPYNYLWNTGATTANIAGLAGGFYSVTINDANNCSTSADGIVVETGGVIVTGATVADVTCNSLCDGSIALDLAGGSTPYSYNWSDASNAADLTNGCAGGYLVTVTDAGGCRGFYTATITEPMPLISSITGTNASCGGTCDGSVDLTVSGGTTPYTYGWSTGDTSEDIANACADTYMAIINDMNGCSTTELLVVTEPAAITAVSSSTTPLCAGDCDGTATITGSGGTGAISYLWPDANTTTSASGLCASTYNVTMTDASGCTQIEGVVVDSPEFFGIQPTVSGVTCAGTCDGSIQTTVVGGQTPYTYLWNNGSSATDLANLCAGSYILSVTDANACETYFTSTMNDPATITVTVVSTTMTCPGSCTGAADIEAAGGAGFFSYQWDTGVITQDASDLCEGSNSVSVTDFSGCQVIASATIDAFAMMTITGSSTENNLTPPNGTATVVVSGGQAPYTYSWDDAFQQTTATATGLSGGVYVAIVTDANSCESQKSVQVWDHGTNGIDELLNNIVLNAFPNPSNGLFNLTVDNVTNGRVDILNNIGQVVYSSRVTSDRSNLTIDAQNWSTGIYSVRVISKETVKTIQLSITR